MDVIQTLDDYGKPAWLTLMVVGFIIFWPIGLAILAYLIWSGRMGFWKGKEWTRNDKRRWHGFGGASGTGNAAFDEYREETLRRLESEAEEFRSFVERLRKARDKAEFDQFMADRKAGGASGAAPA